MSTRPARGPFARVVRWYPSAWRARYGEELVALMEDSYPDGGVPPRVWMGIAHAGIVEHIREVGFAAGDSPAGRVRSGSMLVLWAWALFVIAGASFAKLSEYWSASTPPAARWLPSTAYAAVEGAAWAGAAVVGLAVAAALPALRRYVGEGRWMELRRPVAWAAGLTAVTGLDGLGVVVWAHHLTAVQRNGGSPSYGAVAAVGALLVAATLGGWTLVAIRLMTSLDLSPKVLRRTGQLAVALTAAMTVILAATITWWAAMAADARVFISGTPSGSPVSTQLVVTGLCMLVGLGVGVSGAARVMRSLGSLTRPPA